jgi:hypothetical protein
MSRFKSIWARVMSMPPRIPDGGINVDEDAQEDLRLTVINRDNISKAYGEGPRAKLIREFLYRQCSFRGVRNQEVKRFTGTQVHADTSSRRHNAAASA